MGYNKLSGGELSHLEVMTLTEKFPDDTNGVINTHYLMASLAMTIGGATGSLFDLIKTVELPGLLGPAVIHGVACPQLQFLHHYLVQGSGIRHSLTWITLKRLNSPAWVLVW